MEIIWQQGHSPLSPYQACSWLERKPCPGRWYSYMEPVSSTLATECSSYPFSLQEWDRLILLPDEALACGFMPTDWGMHSLLLGFSSL